MKFVLRYEVKKRSIKDIKNRKTPHKTQEVYGVWDNGINQFVLNFEFRANAACKTMCDYLNRTQPGTKKYLRADGKGSDFK